MQASDFKIGDVVALNSNSPKMTIYSIDTGSLNLVYWNSNLSKFEYITVIAAAVFKT
jgi:uncharacterized protein YodC (DUF2158 family)